MKMHRVKLGIGAAIILALAAELALGLDKTKPESKLVSAAAQHMRAVTCKGSPSDKAQVVRDFYYVKPFLGLTALPDGTILTQAVYTNQPGSVARQAASRNIQFGFLVPDRWRWGVMGDLPLFTDTAAPLPPFCPSGSGQDLLLIPRLHPGPPSKQEPVYRMGGYQTYVSVNHHLLRDTHFLSIGGGRASLTDGLGKQIAAYTCSEMPSADAVEITSVRGDTGSWHVLGTRDRQRPDGSWRRIWLLQAERPSGASPQKATVVDLSKQNPSAATTTDSVFLSPAIDLGPKTRVWFWRWTKLSDASAKADLYELCTWTDGDIVTRDAYIVVKDAGQSRRFAWDCTSTKWREVIMTASSWASATPAVCVSGKWIVVSACDGKIRAIVSDATDK